MTETTIPIAIPSAPAWQRFLPLLAICAAVAVNGLANALPINGYNTGELSRLNPTGFTPAPYAFSIWGLIYTGLFAYGLLCAFGRGEVQERGLSLTPLVLINALANMGWMVVWHYRLMEASVACMAVLLVTLALIFRKLYRSPTQSRLAWWGVDAPMTLYFGWITAASIINVAAWVELRGLYPAGLGMDDWALLSLVAAIVVYTLMVSQTKSVIYGGVFVWSAIAIWVKPTLSDPVQITALGGAIVITGLCVWALVPWRGRARQA